MIDVCNAERAAIAQASLRQGSPQQVLPEPHRCPRDGASPRPVPTVRPWGRAFLLPPLLVFPWLAVCRGCGLHPPAGTVAGLVLALLLTTSVITDVLWRRIFNWATVPALTWALGLQVLALFGLGEVELPVVPRGEWLAMVSPVDAVQGMLVGFAIMFPLYAIFHGGAGDVKLITVVGALLGTGPVVEVIFYGYLLAALFALALLIWQAGPLVLLLRLGALLRVPGAVWAVGPPVRPLLQQRLPMAPFLTAAVLLTLS
jgi:prepilin peptidase CpaA